MLEYFIATPGARKGLVDTALRTADSGYLTRRLVDVAQELIIRERGLPSRRRPGPRHLARGRRARHGRQAQLPRDPAVRPDARRRRHARRTAPCSPAGTDGRRRRASTQLRDDPAVDRVRVRRRSPATPTSASAPPCYGRSLATGKTIELGEAVGVIAAQSIGEPGTQLTMRTFHTGGIAGSDIAGGLPRVVELFEARTPEGQGHPGPHLGRGPHRRGRGQGPRRHHRRRRRHRGRLHRAQPAPASR